VNSYEIAILYDPDLEIDLDKATGRVEKIFKDNGAKVTNVDNWGKRKLAYQIKKNESAVYVIYTVDIPAQSVRKIETTLNITDEVIRFLITKPDLKKVARADAVRAKQAARRGSDSEESDDKEDKEEK
jgi:small subunit ribosomal protein S6